MAKSISLIQDQIIEEFSNQNTWEKKYNYLISLGKALDLMSDSDKIDGNKVKGCQSQVWLKPKLNSDGSVHFSADSDALIVKGLVSLLVRLYSNQMPKDILETPPIFIEKTGLSKHLSASRTNGLNSMVKQIKYYAQAFLLLSQK